MKSKNVIKNIIQNYQRLQKYKKPLLKCKIKQNQQSIINYSNINTNTNSDYKSNKIQFLNIISNNLKKHNTTTFEYKIFIINSIIFDQKIHLVAAFKDYLIWDDTSEFFRIFYFIEESIQIIPKISECYNRYSIISPVYFGLDGLIINIMNNWVRVKLKILEYYIELQELKENNFNEKISKNLNENFEPILKDDLLSTYKSKSQSNWATSKNTIDLLSNDIENNEINNINHKKNKDKISMSFSVLIDELSSHYTKIYQEKKTKTKKNLSKKNDIKNCNNMIKKIIYHTDNNKYNNLTNKIHKLSKANLANKNSQNKNDILVNSKFFKISSIFGKNLKRRKVNKESKEKKLIYKKINNGIVFKSKSIINNDIYNNGVIENKFRALTSNNMKDSKGYHSFVNCSSRIQILKKNDDTNSNKNNNVIKLNKKNINNNVRKSKKQINIIPNIKSENRNSLKIKRVYFSHYMFKLSKQNSSRKNQIKQKEKVKNKGKEENNMDNKCLTSRYIHTNTDSTHNAKNFLQLLKSSNKKNRSRNNDSKLLSIFSYKIKGFNVSSRLTKDNSIKSTSNYFQKSNIINVKNVSIKNKSPSFKTFTIRNSKARLKKSNLLTKYNSKENHSNKNKKTKKTTIPKNSRNYCNFNYLSNTNTNNNSTQSLKNSKLVKLFFTNKTISNIIENNSTNVTITSKKINAKKLNLNIKCNFSKQKKYRHLLLFPKESINKMFDN